MKVFDLIQNIDENMYVQFLKTYDEPDTLKKIYLNTFKKLKNILPSNKPNNIEIVVFKHKNSEYDRDYIIEGIEKIKELDKVPADYEELEKYIYRFSFSFVSWEDVLNYKINDLSIKNIPECLLLTIIIDEITEFGIDEESINERKEEIEKMLDEAERSIEDGNFYTIEDTRTDEEKEASYKKMKQQIDIAMRLYYEYLNNTESN